jgi:hypothetical protein
MELWLRRSTRTRTTGIILVLGSIVLFAFGYVFPSLVLEVSSIVAFAVGISLFTYEVEPRVKVYPASMSILGSMQLMASVMKRDNLVGRGTYVPGEGGVIVAFRRGADFHGSSTFPPSGHGLFEIYERELGDLKGRGVDHVLLWFPRLLVDGLGLGAHVRMKMKANEIETTLEKPFVRSLCVNDFMKQNICSTTGCPLVASIAESLSFASGRAVEHLGCSYDPLTQTASARHLVAE